MTKRNNGTAKVGQSGQQLPPYAATDALSVKHLPGQTNELTLAGVAARHKTSARRRERQGIDMTRKVKPPESRPQNNGLRVRANKGENVDLATARTILGPDFRHAVAVSQVFKPLFGSMDGAPGFGDYSDAIRERGDNATKGELAFVSRTLAAQAMTLDTIFAELARRMALNMGEYLGAMETYGRIALKAQAQSRATLEALAKLHQPREQTVRHVHVNEGGQAVIADQFHHHTGGQENGKTVKQSHATNSAIDSSPAMLGHDAQGNGVPIPGCEEPQALPDARGHQSGRS